ncbi:GATA zinc finger domain-containing protein 1 [Phlebotomus argentipes]|uniref:GATA zinc finger domain-containing protein 1 n=1 Tax=Phlebotomus argentipes TaxID=94469 RepID=UPI0028931CF3|nr:GATA zinc finger domain-containing protein 1 [Phlebotomus argentipes]
MLPKCTQCDRTTSVMWWNVANGEICNECNETKKNGDGDDCSEEKSIRKSTRITRMRIKYNAGIVRGIPKGKSRRNIFKKAPPTKTPTVTATTTTMESLFFGQTYFQVGDIVSLVDKEQNLYYAQIRGLLQDSFCEKSAVITWLIPTTDSPPPNVEFDPATYLIGPDEDFPRRLSTMKFVMHAPNDYYKQSCPYPKPYALDGQDIDTKSYIWSRL